eukprot:572378_1
MLKKFGSMGQSLRDVTKSYATKAAAKINELQTLPQEIPENWDERIDENGKPYYVDTVTGEWYRVRAKQHKRIDTNEKISILTAESKKEFDDQKDKMLDEDSSLSESYSDNDLPSDTPPDDTNTKGGTPNGNGHTNANTNEHETKRTRAKSNHSKRSSTSVSQGWQCGQCTLENVGNAQTCNACLAPRPERPDEDEDELAINSGIQAMEERVTQGSTDDDLLSVEDRQHQQQSTMDAINSAMTESLDALGGDEIKGLTEEQRTQLLMFMDCVETEPEPSIKYLRGSNWDLEHAIETYFQQHPDHPKSRGDVQLDKYRKEVDTLKAELKEQHEDNDRLKVQNEELQIEKDRYAIQSREIQNDWECGQCTFPNVGNAQTCNACLAPRPERNVESTDPQHQRQSTIDAINSAMTESLDALDGVEIKGLTEEQRTQLSMFMGCSESTEVDASIKCLRDANWNPRRALETYFQQHPDPDHRLQQDNGNNEKPKIQQDESNHMVAKNDSSQSSVVPVIDVSDEKGQENQSIIESTKNGVNKQFYMFLQQHRLEQYFDKFKENECHDIRDLEYFDEDFIKNEIGIKSPIQRRRFIGECKKFKVQMDEFKQLNSIPPMLLMKLQTFGIVTMYILCQEVQQELDLKNKFGLGDTQCQLLWNIINDHSQPKSNKMDQAEGITDNVFNHVMDTAR